MALLTTQQVLYTGLTQAPVSANGGGDTVNCGDRTWIEVTNGSGSSINVTLAPTAPDVLARTPATVVVAVAAGATKKIGTMTAAAYGGSTGIASIAYSAVTSVTVGAYSL